MARQRVVLYYRDKTDRPDSEKWRTRPLEPKHVPQFEANLKRMGCYDIRKCVVVPGSIEKNT